MGVANLFAKIDLKATLLATLALLIVAAVTYFLPVAGIILFFVATVPGIILWHKSIMSFGVAALITVVLAVLFGSQLVLSYIIFILILSLVVGQLLKERTSKERILYIATTYMSIISLAAFMLLQVFEKLPLSQVLVKPLKDQLYHAMAMSGLDASSRGVFEEGFRQLAVQLPSYAIIIIFIMILINLIVTFPILRKFKIATPVFKPLYAWHFKRVIAYIYFVVLLCVMFATQPGTFQSIVLNMQIILSFIMFIQGLSFIAFFAKVKRLPAAVGILLMIVGFLITPIIPIVGLLGVVDLCFNLKRFIKK
ncbi:DUF2232 domain-containing protein [Staphylococcus simulans]|uniref:DUF2232 domain-containing protein n=1 Tax=Staphylococcus simulans TaxID=1286 RepID=UPI001E2C7EC4|nr:DUF2232 domain-containing protein [Staphylococcus simulans]MCD8915327.1 DUF2232 domain-containing protein [Staphylococcus simulans]